MTVGERIKALREEKNITQTELAEALDTTKQNIYKYENNIITNIPSDKIEAIASFFGVSPAYIMGWENQTWVMGPDGPMPGWVANMRLENDIEQSKRIKEELKNLVFLPLFPVKSVSIFIESELKDIAQHNIVSFIPYILPEGEKKEDLIFVRVDDDKMHPLLSKGDIALVKMNVTAVEDSLVLVSAASRNGFIARIRYALDYDEYCFSNSYEYPSHKVYRSDNDYRAYKTIGVITEIRHFIKKED